VADVICQLTFPDILAIAAEAPAAFQGKVRKDYPIFQVTQDRRGYTFSNQDRTWQIVLTQDSVAVVATQYAGWAGFRKTILDVSSAFQDVYQPPFFSRVGLRFRSLFRPSQFGVAKPDWKTLINPKVLGPFSIPEVAGQVQGSRHEIVMTFAPGQDRFRLIHGFVSVMDQGSNGKPGETSYLLDQDYFSIQQVACSDAAAKLDHFEREAGRFFGLCVLDTLHQAMAPKAA
jgi:uncharacterized protein (TIGR04255 family)